MTFARSGKGHEGGSVEPPYFFLAQAIEPWVNEKADEDNARGYPGDETFRRLIDLAQQNGATPVHVHDIK